MYEVIPGSVADKAGVKDNDRLLEVNGENIETHDQAVDKIKLAVSSIMFLLVDEETDKYYQNKRVKIGSWLATAKYLPHKPRIIDMTKGTDGYGFLLREEPNQTGKIIINHVHLNITVIFINIDLQSGERRLSSDSVLINTMQDTSSRT